MPLAQVGYKQIFYTVAEPPSRGKEEEKKKKKKKKKAHATVVLVHGLGSSSSYYHPIIPKLVAAGFRCVAFDTTGAGRSPYTNVEQSVGTLADDVAALLTHLDVQDEEDVVVVGHSMGGLVAAEMASRTHHSSSHGEVSTPDETMLDEKSSLEVTSASSHSEKLDLEGEVKKGRKWQGRLRATVWIGPVLPSEKVSDVFRRRIELVEGEGMEAMADVIPKQAPSSTASPLVRAFIRELLLAQDARGYISSCRVIEGADVPRYGHVRCPVLVVAGEEDRSAPVEDCEKMFGRLPGSVKTKSKMVVLEGCGHWHCLEKPEEVAGEIVSFLKKTVGADGHDGEDEVSGSNGSHGGKLFCVVAAPA